MMHQIASRLFLRLRDLTAQIEAGAEEILEINTAVVSLSLAERRKECLPPEKYYTHIETMGVGETGDEAIDDWWSKVPKDRGRILVWRARPEITHEREFNTKKEVWKVYSRFVVIPHENQDAA